MKNKKQASDIDFDRWARIAKEDPEQFESMRKQMIDEQIAKAPQHLRQRLEGLQWRIDQIRRQAENPMAACLIIYQEMWDSVLGKRGLLNALQEPEKLLRTLKKDCANNVIYLKKNRPEGDI